MPQLCGIKEWVLQVALARWQWHRKDFTHSYSLNLCFYLETSP